MIALLALNFADEQYNAGRYSRVAKLILSETARSLGCEPDFASAEPVESRNPQLAAPVV
jgi:hypothetical protein